MAERLESERKRLGLSQAALAEIGGVSAPAQSRYESGKNVPDANYLRALSSAGGDVLFVITGRRETVSYTSEVLLRALVNRVIELDREHPEWKVPADSLVANMYRRIAMRFKPDDDINNLVDEELEYVVSMLPKPGAAEKGAEE